MFRVGLIVLGLLSLRGVANSASRCDVAGDVSRLPAVMSTVTREAGSPQASCGSGLVAPAPSCVGYIQDQIHKDREAGLFKSVGNLFGMPVETPRDACKVVVLKTLETPPLEIEKRLAENSLTTLGADPALVNSCLDQAQLQGNDEKSVAVAEYYLSMNRLKMGAQSSLEILASIDSALGQRLLSDQTCSGSGIQAVDEKCRALQACQPQNGLDQQAAEIEKVLGMSAGIDRQIQELKQGREEQMAGSELGLVSLPDTATKDLKQVEKIHQLKTLKSAILSMYPALEGKAFRASYDPQKGNVKSALQAQLRATRQAISKDLLQYQQGMKCLSGPLSCGACDNLEETLQKTPPFRAQAFRGADSLTSGDLAVQNFLGAAECRQEMRGARQQLGQATTDFAVGAGLTIATAGLGTVAAGAKVAMTAATEARAAGVIGRAAQFAGKELVSIPASARAVLVAKAGGLAIDSWWLSQGVQAAVKECDGHLNQISGKEKVKAVSGCPGGAESAQVQVMANYRACILSSIVRVAPNLLPFAPMVAKGFSAAKLKSAASSSENLAESTERIAQQLTNDGHIQWRQGYQKTLESQGKSIDTPRNKPVPESALEGAAPLEAKARLEKAGFSGLSIEDGKLVQNINQSPEKLVPALNQKLNGGPAKNYAEVVAGRQASRLKDIEEMSSGIHEGWKKSNSWQLEGARQSLAEARASGKSSATIQELESRLREVEVQMGPYVDLPAAEKLKDVVILEQALRAKNGGKLSPSELELIEAYQKRLQSESVLEQKKLISTSEGSKVHQGADAVAKSSGLVAAGSGAVNTGGVPLPGGTDKALRAWSELRATVMQKVKEPNRSAQLVGIRDSLLSGQLGTEVQGLRAATTLYEKGIRRPAGAPQDALGHVLVEGQPVFFRNAEEFFGTNALNGAAGRWIRSQNR
ncbi:MAG: hypothetical protein KGQ59_09960 [Bdellovibrionales bacterium]|nr:hypothetical protein [Bdellovibrionales bacterium]